MRVSRSYLLGSAVLVLAVAALALAACAPRPLAAPEPAEPSVTGPPRRDDAHVLDVLTFNAALLPEFVASTDQAARAAVMAPYLMGYDVLVMQELFVDAWREDLLQRLARFYPYRTDVVGIDGARGFALRQDGGVVILSHWPIVREGRLLFGATCSGTDCLADKGVAYAAIDKGGQTYHLFVTHAQSEFGFGVERVRAAQFALMRAFVEAQGIPDVEPVLLAGDLNVDAYSPELDSMLATLHAVRPATIGSLPYTWDPQRNALASGPAQWLDYVLYSADHLHPVASWNRAVRLHHGTLDLSDHFAVWGRVVLEGP